MTHKAPHRHADTGHGRNMEAHGSIRLADALNKKVLSDSGREIGKISDIRIDPDSLEVAGISVKRGILARDMFVARRYIQSLGDQGAILKITPVTQYKGMKVFDLHGKEVGSVKEVRAVGSTNNAVSLVVDRGITRKKLVIDKSDVMAIGESVLLYKGIESITD